MWIMWPYDLYPYYCVGQASEGPDDRGFYKVPAYQASFKASHVVSDKVGKQLKELISILRKREQEALARIHKEGAEEIRKLLNCMPRIKHLTDLLGE